MELGEARALFQEGRHHRRVEGRRLAVGCRGLLITLQPVQRSPFPEPCLRMIRVERQCAVERRHGAFVALLAFEGQCEQVPSFHVLGRVARRPIEAVDRLCERVQPIVRAPFLVPEVGGRARRLDRDVIALHRIGISAEGEQEGRFVRGRIRVRGSSRRTVSYAVSASSGWLRIWWASPRAVQVPASAGSFWRMTSQVRRRTFAFFECRKASRWPRSASRSSGATTRRRSNVAYASSALPRASRARPLSFKARGWCGWIARIASHATTRSAHRSDRRRRSRFASSPSYDRGSTAKKPSREASASSRRFNWTHAWAFAYNAPPWRGSRETIFDASLTTSSHRARDRRASSRPTRGASVFGVRPIARSYELTASMLRPILRSSSARLVHPAASPSRWRRASS